MTLRILASLYLVLIFIMLTVIYFNNIYEIISSQLIALLISIIVAIGTMSATVDCYNFLNESND